MDGLCKHLLSKANEVLVVSVDVGKLHVDQQENLWITHGYEAHFIYVFLRILWG